MTHDFALHINGYHEAATSRQAMTAETSMYGGDSRTLVAKIGEGDVDLLQAMGIGFERMKPV